MPIKRHPPRDFQAWVDKYVAGDISTIDIAAGIGCAKATVLKWMDEIGVCRNPAGAQIAKKMTGRPSSRAGVMLSDETRAKISRARANVAMPHRRGEKRSDEARQKMREGHAGRRLTAEEMSARVKVRQLCKQMLSRVLAMARVAKMSKTELLLGYTRLELRQHLERQFRDGMSWQNRSSFHVDHILPVAHFMRQGITCPATINALKNLQVLTPAENLSKSDKLVHISFSDNPRHQALQIDAHGTRPMFA